MDVVFRGLVVGVLSVVTVACAGGPPAPASLDTRVDVCADCRMAVSNQAFAAQIVAPGTEPLFFDDIGCLATYLGHNTRLPPRAIAYVADHLTGEWVSAVSALYTRNLQVATPMSSHVIAHANLTNQQADPAAVRGARVTTRELFMLDVPDGTR